MKGEYYSYKDIQQFARMQQWLNEGAPDEQQGQYQEVALHEKNARELARYLVETVSRRRQTHGFTDAEALRAFDLAKNFFNPLKNVLAE